MLSLPEKLMLLALNDEKGSVVMSASAALPYGLAGSILIELHLRNKIAFENKKIALIDSSPTGDPLLDNAITLIRSSDRNRHAKHWVQKINSKIKGLSEHITGSLVEKGILAIEERKILWVFPSRRYPMIDDAPEQDVRTRIREVVIQEAPPDDSDVVLLSLILACDLVAEVFPREERKLAKKRLKVITANEQIGRAVKSVVEEITAAIVATTIAAGAATSVTSS